MYDLHTRLCRELKSTTYWKSYHNGYCTQIQAIKYHHKEKLIATCLEQMIHTYMSNICQVRSLT